MKFNIARFIKLDLIKVLIASTLITSCTTKNENEIVVGHFGSMTGSEATFGLSTDEGIKMAFDEVNAAGGVKGKKLKLITMDDQGKAEEAATVVTRLIEQKGVVALLGEVASTRSLAAAPIAQAKKIPMITPSSTNPDVTKMGDYIFRTCFIDPFQGPVMAKFATESLKVKNVAILRDVKSDYSVGLANNFIEKFKALGGKIVADKSYQSQDVDFNAQLNALKTAKPDAIFIPGYYTEVGLIALQARNKAGITVPLLGGDGWDSPKLSEIGQKAIDGSYFSNHFSNESKDPVAVEFINNFKKKFNKEPDGLSAAGYDAAMVLVEAMKASPDLNPTSIRNAIAAVKDYKGVTGNITIDADRNASKSAVIVQVQGTINKYVTTVNP